MGGWSGEQGGIDNMGKDIDRNITRQLWERLKNAFTRNDVIPIENGGYNIKRIRIAPYRSEISILNNLLNFYGNFNENNEYKINFNNFFPFI